MGAGAHGRGQARVLRRELCELGVEECAQRVRRPRYCIATAVRRVQRHLEPVRQITGGLRVGERAVRIDVRGRAHAFPGDDRTARWAELLETVEVTSTVSSNS